MKFSAASMALRAVRKHRGWPPMWRPAEPRRHYDVLIVGGGGHGLSTAYYLAANHGISNVAVLEKGWIGRGNTGRNTTIVRSNYLHGPSTRFYDHSLQLYETLAHELNINLMFSQRGVVNLAYGRQELRAMNRRVNALRHLGIESRMLSLAEIGERVPLLNLSREAARPIFGGFIQERGGICRHDAVAWGYARGADALGVDIIQGCEVTDFDLQGGQVIGVHTSLGHIGAEKVALAVAGHSNLLANRAGFELPLTCLTLQAMVTEPVSPMLDVVLDGPVYVSQSDRGEMVIGGGTDLFNSHAQRGMAATAEQTFAAIVDLFPSFAGLSWLRQWAGMVDYTPDHSPIMGMTPVSGLYISGGWGSYGFKAIPAGGVTMAQTIAQNCPHPLIKAFSLERFASGALIDEGASAAMDLESAIL